MTWKIENVVDHGTWKDEMFAYKNDKWWQVPDSGAVRFQWGNLRSVFYFLHAQKTMPHHFVAKLTKSQEKANSGRLKAYK